MLLTLGENSYNLSTFCRNIMKESFFLFLEREKHASLLNLIFKKKVLFLCEHTMESRCKENYLLLLYVHMCESSRALAIHKQCRNTFERNAT